MLLPNTVLTQFIFGANTEFPAITMYEFTKMGSVARTTKNFPKTAVFQHTAGLLLGIISYLP